jgi:hypothetical protein
MYIAPKIKNGSTVCKYGGNSIGNLKNSNSVENMIFYNFYSVENIKTFPYLNEMKAKILVLYEMCGSHGDEDVNTYS